jgi:hypothetical protein
VKLLKLLVFLNPDGVLVEFLVNGAGALEKDLKQVVLNELEMAEALIMSEKYSLIKWDRVKNALSIHRLVQMLIKDEMLDSELTSALEVVVDLCNQSFPLEINNETRQKCRLYEGQVVETLL